MNEKERRKLMKKMENLLMALSQRTQNEVDPATYINTLTLDIGDDELNFWGNFDPPNEDDINTVEEIYEVSKKIYEEENR